MTPTEILNELSKAITALNTILLGDGNTNITLGGVVKPSITKHIETALSAYLGAIGVNNASLFETKALMTASSLSDNSFAVVYGDATSTNNGYYVKKSGSWTLAQWNPSKVAIDTVKALIASDSLLTPTAYVPSATHLDRLPTGYQTITNAQANAIPNFPYTGQYKGGWIFTFKGTSQFTYYQKYINYRHEEGGTINAGGPIIYERVANGASSPESPNFAWNPWMRVYTSKMIDNKLAENLASTTATIQGLKSELLLRASESTLGLNLLPLSVYNADFIPSSTHSSIVTAEKDGKPPKIVIKSNPASTYAGFASAMWNMFDGGVGNFPNVLPTLKATGFYSAMLVIDSYEHIQSGYVQMIQRDVSGTTLRVDTLNNLDAGSKSEPTVCFIDGASILPNCNQIYLLIRAVNDPLIPATVKMSRFCITPTRTAGWMEPDFSSQEVKLKLEYFPNTKLTSDKSSLYEASVSDGVLTMQKGVKQVWYDVAVSDIFKIGETITWECKGFADNVGETTAEGGDITLIFFNSSDAQINTIASSRIKTANEWVDLKTVERIPEGTAKIRFRICARATADLVQFKEVTASVSGGRELVINPSTINGSGQSEGINGTKLVYISANGSDETGDGTLSNPWKTLAKARSDGSRQLMIFVGDGIYEATGGMNLGQFEHVVIRAMSNCKPVFLMSPKTGVLTKTLDFNNVYQMPLATSPSYWVYIHDVPDESMVIPLDKRQPHQKGRYSRLPSTRLSQAANVGDLDGADKPMWFWEAGTLYVNLAGAVPDPLTADIRVPTHSTPLVAGANGKQMLEMSGIRVQYVRGNGLSCVGLSHVRLDNVTSLMNNGQGFALNDTPYIHISMCEAGSNRGDGFNMHRNLANPSQADCTYVCENSWTHDNYDDGDSMHENYRGYYHGNLYEYNGDRGVATSYGSHCTAVGCIARNNGQIFKSMGADGFGSTNGEGFAVVGEVNPEHDNGVGTQMVCIACHSEENILNYSNSSLGGSLESINCSSVRALGTGYHAITGALHKIRNCTDIGSKRVKSPNVIVENGELVT